MFDDEVLDLGGIGTETDIMSEKVDDECDGCKDDPKKEKKKDEKEIKESSDVKKSTDSIYEEYVDTCIEKGNEPLDKEDFMKLLENTEFAPGSYATNDVKNHVGDPHAKAPSNETPSAKPYDQREIPIPGGDKEAPNAKPYDQASVPAASPTVLDDTTYNKMLRDLQKTFKECGDIMHKMSTATVVHKTQDDLQSEYTESAIGQAILESFENGPIFEAVDRDDKKAVKAITQGLRSKVEADIKAAKGTFCKANAISKALSGDMWKNHMWQLIGVCHFETGNASDVVSSMNTKYKKELGDYKILSIKSAPGIVEKLKSKFGWSSIKNTYFLIVDKKVPKEFVEMQKKEATPDEKSEAKTESYDEDLEYAAYVTEATKYQTYKNTYEKPDNDNDSKSLAVAGSNGDRNMKYGTLDRKEFNSVRKQYKDDLDKAYDEYKSYYAKIVKEYGKEAAENMLGKRKPRHQFVGETIAILHKKDGHRFA